MTFDPKKYSHPLLTNRSRNIVRKDYPKWLEQCEHILRNHHWVLQHEFPVLKFTFLAENTGTRPADDALITIEASGNFQIKPLSAESPREFRRLGCLSQATMADSSSCR